MPTKIKEAGLLVVVADAAEVERHFGTGSSNNSMVIMAIKLKVITLLTLLLLRFAPSHRPFPAVAHNHVHHRVQTSRISKANEASYRSTISPIELYSYIHFIVCFFSTYVSFLVY